MAYTYKNPNQFEVTIQSPTGGALNVPYNGVVKGAFFAQYETAGILATVADPGSGYTFEVTDATAPLTNTLAIGDVFSVADQAARLALTTAEKGDIAVQADTGITYMLSAAPASTNGNWVAIANAVAGTATAVTAANEATDTTCFPLFVTAATGDLGPKTNAALTFNSNTANLACTTFTGALVGNASTATTAAAGTTVVVTDEATDTTCFPLFVTAATGNLGSKTNSGLTFNALTAALSTTGTITAANFTLSALNTAPTSKTMVGNAGEIRFDASYMYVCTTTGIEGAANWKRVALDDAAW